MRVFSRAMATSPIPSAQPVSSALPGGLSRADARRLLVRRSPFAFVPGWAWLAVIAAACVGLALAGQLAVVFAVLLVVGVVVLAAGPLRRPAYGLLVTAQSQTAIHRLVTDTAAGVGQPPPDGVWLVPIANAMAVHRRRAWYRGGRVDVILGLPLVEVLDADALAAVVAHELAHVRVADALLDTLLVVRARLVNDVEGRGTPPRPGERRFLDLTRPVAYQVELDCDAVAARHVGPVATARSLRAAQQVALLYDSYFATVVDPLIGTWLFPADFYEGWQAWWAKPEALRAAAALEAELDAGEAATATHPNLAQRLALLDAYAAPAGYDELPPTVPLADPETIRQQAVAALAGRQCQVVPFAEVPEHAYDPNLNSGARDTLAAARGLDASVVDARGVLALVGRGLGSALAERLNPALLGEVGAVRANSTHRALLKAVTATVCADLRARGWRWRSPLSRFVLYPPDGSTGADVEQLAAAYLSPTGAQWDRQRLVGLLS